MQIALSLSSVRPTPQGDVGVFDVHVAPASDPSLQAHLQLRATLEIGPNGWPSRLAGEGTFDRTVFDRRGTTRSNGSLTLRVTWTA